MSSGENKESPLPVASQSGSVAQPVELKNEMLKLLKQKMDTEKEGREERVKLEERVRNIEEKVSGLSLELSVDLIKLRQKIYKIQSDMGSADSLISGVKENRDKLLQMESKSELLMDILEKKDQNIQTQLQQLSMQIETKLQKSREPIKTEKKMNCFALIRKNRFKPDVEWEVVGRATEGEWFKWSGYPVVGRVKIGQDYHGHPTFSLQLEYQNEEKFFRDFKSMPNVYYRWRSTHKHAAMKSWVCFNVFHLFGENNSQQLRFNYTLTKFHSRDSLNEHFLVEVYIEAPSMTQMVRSYDGTLNWTINKYTERKGLEREGLIQYQESPYFYTGPSGYRVQLHVYLDGVGKYKRAGLTVQVSFLSGEFDAELSGSFPHRTTVTLTNANDPEYNVTKTVEKNIVEEKSYAVGLCDVKAALFALKNDALTFKVVIESM